MLLIVLGAGASYDAIPVYPPPGQEQMRLPLANDLFADRYLHNMSGFPKGLPIIPYLRGQYSSITIERVLQQLQDEGTRFTERYNQLAAVRYYLQLTISGLDLEWYRSGYGVTNHLTMFDQIRSVQGDQKVCIVTFNYDRIVETVLAHLGVKFTSIDDYVSNDLYILVKLHGSVNWGREVESPIEGLPEIHWIELIRYIIDHAHELNVSDQFYVFNEERPTISKSNEKALYPAIAIPLETKTDYECPKNHIDYLSKSLADVNIIIVVGWRAVDLPFAQMLARTLKGNPPTLVVADSEASAQEPIGRLRAVGVPGVFRAAKAGFTQTVTNREIEQFLRQVS